MPEAFFGVVAVAIMAGTVLALANAYGDLGKDRLSGTTTVATLLGSRRTLLADAVLLVAVQFAVLATTVVSTGATPLLVVEGIGCGLGWLGLGLAAAGGRARLLVWEIQAVGVVVLGAGWLAVLNSAGMLRS